MLPFDSVQNVKLFVNGEVLLMARDSEICMLHIDSLTHMSTTSYYREQSDELQREALGFNHSGTIKEQLNSGVKRYVKMRKEQ